MDELLRRRKQILTIIRGHLREIRIKGLKVWGPALGATDAIMEDLIILQEIKESLTLEQWKEFVGKLLAKERGKRMADEDTTKRYFAARDRALERHVESANLISEAEQGFSLGLRWATIGPTGPSFAEVELDWIKEKIKSENNFAFGFVCGVLSRLEAVKGKHYAGSWQKRGEDGILRNLERKVDRLDILVNEEVADSTAGENLTQSLGDAAVYSMKWITLRAEIDPQEFINWVEEVRKL